MGDREAIGNEDRQARESRWPRIAYASAVAVLVVGTFGSFGGISYAASGSGRVAHTVERVATGKHVAITSSSASNQYNHKVAPKPEVKAVVKAAVKNRKPSTPVATGTPTGTLPFTGFSLLGTLLLGCALIVTGMLLRLRERRTRG
jgi:hypothetical protein